VSANDSIRLNAYFYNKVNEYKGIEKAEKCVQRAREKSGISQGRLLGDTGPFSDLSVLSSSLSCNRSTQHTSGQDDVLQPNKESATSLPLPPDEALGPKRLATVTQNDYSSATNSESDVSDVSDVGDYPETSGGRGFLRRSLRNISGIFSSDLPAKPNFQTYWEKVAEEKQSRLDTSGQKAGDFR
jgi:hypothetical protein